MATKIQSHEGKAQFIMSLAGNLVASGKINIPNFFNSRNLNPVAEELSFVPEFTKFIFQLSLVYDSLATGKAVEVPEIGFQPKKENR